MSEGKRARQYQNDAEQVLEELAQHQNPDGNVEISLRVQDGFVTLIETTKKRKPQKVD